MENAKVDEAQAEIKIARRYVNNFGCADDTTLMAESKELKNLVMKEKEESEKLKLNVLICGLKVRIQKIISWHLVPSLHGK